MYRMLPRMPVPFSHSCLQSLGIGGYLLTLENNSSADFFQFFSDLVCCTIGAHSKQPNHTVKSLRKATPHVTT